MLAAYIAAATLVLALFVTAFTWRVSGGRWLVVRTPSMGQAMPVGTLILIRPVTASDVQVGDIITFRPPHSSVDLSHRVVAIDAAGIHTRGDLNSAQDPYPLHQGDLIGRVVARWWGIGWLLRAIPILMGGLLVLWLVTRYLVNHRWRAPLRIVGVAGVVTLALLVFRPLVGAQVLETSPSKNSHRTIDVRVVSTGLLPTRVKAHSGNAVNLVDGRAHTLTANAQVNYPRHTIRSYVHMPPSWWIVMGMLCLSPLVWCTTVGLPPEQQPA